jgi:hypothetical protein
MVTTTEAQGRTATVEFPAIYDGKTYPVEGPGRIGALALVKINNFQSIAMLKHAGNIIASAERTISEDGRVLTISYKQSDEDRPVEVACHNMHHVTASLGDERVGVYDAAL